MKARTAVYDEKLHKEIHEVKIDTTVSYWHPCLEGRSEVQWVILCKNRLEGYKTLEDAIESWPAVAMFAKPLKIMAVSHNIVAAMD